MPLNGPAAQGHQDTSAPRRGGDKRCGPDDRDSFEEAYFANESGVAAPGFGRRTEPPAQPQGAAPAGDGEVDPLDAYMAALNADLAKADTAVSIHGGQKTQKQVAPWEDLANDDDPVASYFEAHEKAPQLDAEGEVVEVGDRRKQAIDPMSAIDHSKITYNVVRTEFYTPHEDVKQLDESEVAELRKGLRISATGPNIVSPVPSFGLLADSLGKELMDAVRRHGYSQPTPIQAQAIPVALSGRDVIGIAETGSGKTVAYLLPMLVHCIAQPELAKGEGPIGVVMCPTRELAVQIEQECTKFNRQLGLRSVTLAGGLSKLEQFKEIKRGAEIAICNPGRLIDIVKMRGCSLQRVTFVVLDEADRMFHLGFEYQVRSIVQNVRPSRQTLLFSATFPPKIEKLARDILQSPARITIGVEGQVASSVVQHVEVFKDDDEKWPWLAKNVNNMLLKGQVLIFVKSIASAEELTQNFTDFLDKKTEVLHGEMDQGRRMMVLKAMKKRKADVLIATDVAARGLDIPSIATVISYDAARDIETHTHRVGRTGRAGAAGQAYTFLSRNVEEGKRMAALLADSMEQSGQTPSEDHMAVAMKYAPYRSAKLEGKKFAGKKRGGAGGKQVHSAYGVGFDGTAQQKETPKEFEQRLNSEADRLTAVNRAVMSKVGAGRAGFVTATATLGGGTAGFVAAALSDDKPALPPNPVNDGSSDDDDLFAPGVSSAFGKAPPPKPKSQQQEEERRQHEQRQQKDQQRIMQQLYKQEQLGTRFQHPQQQPQYPQPQQQQQQQYYQAQPSDAAAFMPMQQMPIQQQVPPGPFAEKKERRRSARRGRSGSRGRSPRQERRGSRSRDRARGDRDRSDRDRDRDRDDRDQTARDRSDRDRSDRDRDRDRDRERERQRDRSRSKDRRRRRSPSL